MTDDRFKQILERNKEDTEQLCFEYFSEEKTRIPIDQFKQAFQMWIMLNNLGDLGGGLEKIKQYLKNKHGV